MFFIRSVFWLTIVFAALPWPQDANLQSQKLLAETAAGLIRSAGGEGAVSPQECLAAPQACAAEARKLQALFEAVSKSDARRLRPAS